MNKIRGCKSLLILLVLALCIPSCYSLLAQQPAAQPATLNGAQKVILDTDIGGDIDDVFALALLLSNPKIQVIGVTTATGDTDLRARLTARFLKETGHSDIPVAAGIVTKTDGLSQERWARGYPEPAKGWPDAIEFTLDAIRRNPGQITLIGIGPLTNVGAMIDKDPATFRKLKQVVIMGGSVRRGYGDMGYLLDSGPSSEYNIRVDIPAARKLFASGVPLYVMPVDSTQLKLDEIKRGNLFSQGTPATDALSLLYWQWSVAAWSVTPTLFDAMAVGVVMNPDLCPTTPLHLDIDDKGFTREAAGKPNTYVCLDSDSDKFFRFYFKAVLGQ